MPTPRDRARAATTEAIVEAARHQLAEVGPAALSLRGVAREIGVVSSAVYRYVASRDELLTLLVVRAYDDLGEAVEEAAARARADDRELLDQWLATTRALRTWALAHPHDWALVYGSPVPGYAAPERTVAPATRAVAVWTGLAVRAGATPGPDVPAAPDDVVAHLRAFLRDQGGDVGSEVLSSLATAMIETWVQLVGTVSFELFGHFENVVDDRTAWFDLVAEQCWQRLVGPGTGSSGTVNDVIRRSG